MPGAQPRHPGVLVSTISSFLVVAKIILMSCVFGCMICKRVPSYPSPSLPLSLLACGVSCPSGGGHSPARHHNGPPGRPDSGSRPHGRGRGLAGSLGQSSRQASYRPPSQCGDCGVSHAIEHCPNSYPHRYRKY